MLVRPRDLADQMSHTHQIEIFTLSVDAARCKAREIIGQSHGVAYCQSLRSGDSFPTVRSNLPSGIFRLQINAKILGGARWSAQL